MKCKFFLITILFFLNNCAAPGSAYLGPIITGATSKSLTQASLSYSSGIVVKSFKESKIFNQKTEIFTDKKINNSDPVIILAYAVDEILISEVYEPEPLP